MSLKYVPSNAPSLTTPLGVLFAPNSIYKTPLSSNTELFDLIKASFLLILHKKIICIACISIDSKRNQ